MKLATGQEDLDKLAEVGNRIFDMFNTHLRVISKSTLAFQQDHKKRRYRRFQERT